MTHPVPKFQEEFSAKIPALTLLTQLGWTFLPPKQALAARNNKYDQVVLSQILREELSKRAFVYAGKRYPLSAKSVDNLVSELCTPALNEGLMTANERIYNHLLYGMSVTEFIDGKKVSPTIALIDWHHPHNNRFTFTEEFHVTRASGIESRRPDSNAKKGPTVKEGISQTIRNQLHGEIPLLFAYSQLLLSISGIEGRYGTCGTTEKFWAAWREEDISDAQMAEIKNRPIGDRQAAGPLPPRVAARRSKSLRRENGLPHSCGIDDVNAAPLNRYIGQRLAGNEGADSTGQ